jgi:hypothetical protein
MAELMGRNEYARHRGCSPNAVSKAIKDGRIAKAAVLDTDGTLIGIKWRLADELWTLNTDPEQQLRGNGGVLPAGPAEQLELGAAGRDQAQAARDADDDASDARLADRDELVRQRTEKARLDNAMAELDLKKRRGELVSVAEEREVRARRYRAMRDKLLGMPDREAAVMAAELKVDAAQLRVALERMVKKALHELSDDARSELARGAAESVAA